MSSTVASNTKITAKHNKLADKNSSESMDRRELAKKVLAGKRLTTAEKHLIYSLLTGETAEKKRKLTKNDVRNANLAADYLIRASEERGDLSEIRATLAKQYNLPGLEECSSETFYKAVRRGIDVLGAHCAKQLDMIDKNQMQGSIDKNDLLEMIGSFLESEQKYKLKSNRNLSTKITV